MSYQERHQTLTREHWIVITTIYAVFSFVIGGICGLATGWVIFAWL